MGAEPSVAARDDGSFEELLRRYWAAQPDVAPELIDRFVTGDLVGADRAAAVADQIESERAAVVRRDEVVLEVGAGTAALATELGRRATFVVASDVSLAWMLLARRRLADAGLDNVALVVATGDALPFADRTFDLVVAADVVEHVPDAIAFVGACHRALRAGGTFWLATPNRFSLTPEPHVRVWGVGFVPRAWAPAYVRKVRGVAYDDIRTLSRGELVRLLARTGGTVDVTPPAITGPVARTSPPLTRRAIAVYNRAAGSRRSGASSSGSPRCSTRWSGSARRMADAPALVCPVCRTGLDAGAGRFTSASCRREYPVVAGIPDLRIDGDRYLTIADDRVKAEALARVSGGFADVVAAYWERTPEVPAPLAARYTQAMLDEHGTRRGPPT